MPYSLQLPKKFRQWRAKIRDKEKVEPPHVTLLRKTLAWRLDLRTGEFMDREPDPKEVPPALLKLVRQHWEELRAAWDAIHPENRIESGENEEEPNE